MTEPRLHIEIEKRLAAFELRIDVAIGSEILVLFGPSGGGKTQTLQAIAGLMTPDAGTITLDSQTFFRRSRPGSPANLPARKRRVGYVFQQYALFPHMTALENVAYALWRQPGARDQALALLERVGLAHRAGHMPHELSGGQQQRVAIARALAAAPRLLLLDESFSALDRPIRDRLHHDLRMLQAEEGLVVIYVTHNLDDAFAVGHRLAVVREGRIEQVGSLDTVFQQPASRSVLDILGIPNAFSARVMAATAAGLQLDWAGLDLEAPAEAVAEGSMVHAYIRPEDVKVLYPDRPVSSAVAHNQVVGTVVRRRPGRQLDQLLVALPNDQLIEVAFPQSAYATLPLGDGAPVRLSVRKEKIVVFHRPAGERQGVDDIRENATHAGA